MARQTKAEAAAAAAAEQAALMAEAEEASEDFFDLSDVVAERGGQAHPAGTFIFELTQVKKGVTGDNAKAPGLPKLAITFTNVQGEYKGRKCFKHLVLKGDQAGRSRAFLDDLGLDTSGTLKLHELEGIFARLTVTVQKDNAGFNNIDKVEVLDGPDGAEEGDDELN